MRRDYFVQLPCPECNNNVVHRYECNCLDKFNYCTENEKHVFFFCTTCNKRANVTWEDYKQPTHPSRTDGPKGHEYEALSQMFGEMTESNVFNNIK